MYPVMVEFLIKISDVLLLIASTSKISVILLLTMPVISVLNATSAIVPSTVICGILGLAGRPDLIQYR